MSSGYVLLLALVTGVHAATWGAFKDSPFEGFKTASFVRSVVVAVVMATVLTLTTEAETLPLLVLFGVLYAMERLATEWWKSFFREDDEDAYAIPMRVAVRGRPIDARAPRYLAGLVVLAGAALIGCAAVAKQPETGGPLWLRVLVGAAGGWLTAVGGAWKDAPIEGFSGWKFLRSPVVATAWTLLLLPFTHDWVTLTVAAGGLSVLSIETYKTFFTGGRPPGKFAGKPTHLVALTQRETCRLLHSGVYGVLACAVGMAALLGTGGRPATEVISLVLLAVTASGVALLVALNVTDTEASVRRRVGPHAVRS